MKILCSLIIALLFFCQGGAVGKTEAASILVSAAASLTDAVKELGQIYQSEHPGVGVSFNFGSSGALQTQIEEGAPADVFISAAQKQMDALDGKGLLLPASRRNLLINSVVLIVPQDSALALGSFQEAAESKVKSIALGEPQAVPVGQYAEEIFGSLSLLATIKAKANYGSDVRQVLAWVASGNVDCGVVYATDAASTSAVTIAAYAPPGSHKPVVYPAAVLKASSQTEEAQSFLAFLSGEKAKAIFAKYGFTAV